MAMHSVFDLPPVAAGTIAGFTESSSGLWTLDGCRRYS
jgi:hypothetical protein